MNSMSFRNKASKGKKNPSHALPSIQEGEFPFLINLTVDRLFDYHLRYRLTSMAIRSGGMLENCNGEIAMFQAGSE
jgi:hypothetical protein